MLFICNLNPINSVTQFSPFFSKIKVIILEFAEANLSGEFTKDHDEIDDHWNKDNGKESSQFVHFGHDALVAFEQNVKDGCEAEEAGEQTVPFHCVLEILANVCE